MIREAGPADVGAMEQFLAARAPTSMFLRGNLATHGTDDRVHRHGTTFYLGEADGAVVAIGGITNQGHLMCQSAGAPLPFHAAFAATLKGRQLLGMTGDPAEVEAVFDALGCQAATFGLRVLQPLFALGLDDLANAKPGAGCLRRPVRRDLGLLKRWFRTYHDETGTAPPGGTDGTAEAARFLSHPDARLLVMEQTVVAMSAFNAQAPGIVQVGGVFVPPELRGRGYGGSVVARQLAEVRNNGTRRAILFAASEPAARAYRRIGFQQIGAYEIALIKDPWEVPA